MYMRRGLKIVLFATGFATILTVLLGFVDVTPQGIVGAIWHGWPFAWRYVIVYPSSPENYDIKNFVSDVIVWFILITAICGLLSLIPRRRGK